jgi:hypothetical protein
MELSFKKPPNWNFSIPITALKSFESTSEKSLLFDEERTAIGSGPAEMIIYALPTCRALGINHLVLNVNPHFTLREAVRLSPLLLAQSYLKKVTVVTTAAKLENIGRIPHILYNFDQYLSVNNETLIASEEWIDPKIARNVRKKMPVHAGQTVAESQGIQVPLFESWLESPTASDARKSVVVCTEKSKLPAWYWNQLLKGLQVIYFVGNDSEFIQQVLPGARYLQSANSLDRACSLASASFFIGNQGLDYAISEGLKIARLVEITAGSPYFPIGPRGLILSTDLFEARKQILELLPEDQAKLYEHFTKKLRQNPFAQIRRQWVRLVRYLAN